jgi:DtxR family Mn-dependent transcriptional regulator
MLLGMNRGKIEPQEVEVAGVAHCFLKRAHKLEKRGFVKHHPYRGVRLLKAGRTIAQRVVRNHRLIETLMKTLNIEIDENFVCGIEHHMNESFAKALFTFLGSEKVPPWKRYP